LEERPELRAQKSLDGEDSASDKGSVMEETNNHLYQDLLDGVLKMKDSNGRMICELFLKLPPRQVSMLCKLNSSFKVVVTTYQVKSPCNVCVLF
jgi:hypothetical protein